MAVSGSIVYVRHQIVSTSKAARMSGSVVYIAHRNTSSLYTGSGLDEAVDQTNRRVRKPNSSTPFGRVDKDGRVWIDAQWDRYFEHIDKIRLGGPLGPNLPDIETTVTTAQAQAATVAATTAGLTQQVSQNAESLAATVEVAQNNALTGATQIPPVQRTSGIEP